MKKNPNLFKIILLTIILSGFIVNNSWAEDKKPTKEETSAAAVENTPVFKAAVLDSEVILKQSKATKALRDQVQTKWSEYNKKLQEEQKTLYTKNQKMVEEKSKLTAADLKSKEDEFQKKQTELSQQETSLQIKAQEEKQKLNEAFNNGLKDIEKEFSKIVEEYKEKNKITFLARKDMLISSDPKYDITEVILQELDKKMPTYKVKFKEE